MDFPAQLGRASLKRGLARPQRTVARDTFPGPIGPGLIEAHAVSRIASRSAADFPAQLGRASLKRRPRSGALKSACPFPGPIGPGLIEAR